MSPNQLNSSESENMPSNEVSIFIKERELWEKFRNLTNEMIVTTAGRRMFPVLKAGCLNMEADSMYTVLLEFVHIDGHRWKYDNGDWRHGCKVEVTHSKSVYTHPDSPNYGAHWMRESVCFSKVKLSNKMSDNKQTVMLNSLHKYEPRVHVIKLGPHGEKTTVATKSFPETQFVAVTAYQNEEITSLKIKYNPFAKAFKDAKERPDQSKRDQRDYYDSGIDAQKHLPSLTNSWVFSSGQSPLQASQTQQLANGFHAIGNKSCDRFSMHNHRTVPYQLQRYSEAEVSNSSRNYETWTLPSSGSEQNQYVWPVNTLSSIPSTMSGFQVCGTTTLSPYTTHLSPSVAESVASSGSPHGSYSGSGSGCDSLPMQYSSPQTLKEHYNWNNLSSAPV